MLSLGAVAILGACSPFQPSVEKSFSGGAGGTIYDSSGDRTYNDYNLSVTHSGTVYGIKSVTLKGLRHPYASDLTISIVDPSGDPYALIDRKGSSNDYSGDYVFADGGNAGLLVSDGLIVPGAYAADTSMAQMAYDVSLKGDWKLRITDSTASDSGSLTGWEMVLWVSD
jgi:subtilisin-like proprotein convertase family protein